MTDTPRAIPDLSKDMVNAMAASAAAAAEAARRINDELLEFARLRFENDAGVAEAMVKAESLADIVALQRDFLVSTFESYAVETSKLRKMAMDMTKDISAAEPVSKRAA
ncbi:MAG: phasin family protein [Parvibaculum sp.]|uniref:phasin family protein n=1 Tax=Parvibaculum sp. TaxID=2024848 RepID=UPI002ABA5F89|nr:phasin family protein [Parvibaculum sp.]MDZ4380905.1 phasin family protein [Parvibaculum sp.]